MQLNVENVLFFFFWNKKRCCILELNERRRKNFSVWFAACWLQLLSRIEHAILQRHGTHLMEVGLSFTMHIALLSCVLLYLKWYTQTHAVTHSLLLSPAACLNSSKMFDMNWLASLQCAHLFQVLFACPL